MPESLRPGFGPTLPALLRDRFGIAPRTTLLLAVGLAAAVAAAVLFAVYAARDPQLVHEGDPVFNLIYDDQALHVAKTHPGELERLEGRRRRVTVSVTVRGLELPAYRGDVAKGLLPLRAELYMDALRRRDPTFQIRDEGRSTVNDSPGYQFGYRTGTPGHYVYWRDIFVVPDEDAPREGVQLTFENHRPDRIGPRGTALVHAGRSALRSFKFGTDRR